ncbi:hypothetical protein CARUB_v10021552mg [Capsella rubella]|uniref:SRP54-type proteins GTP-binding domain-containing protein n=1 Tax=Capsella rubella TaxID=81985 RepID=R0IBQ5_9BRAS|nr:hypothetical protein CARUB_v10021552mg [Capsella rubella]
MAFDELRGRLGRSFEKMRETSKMDEMMLNSFLKEITCTLLDADFPKLALTEIERQSQDIINLPASSNKGKLIYEIILTELVSKLDPGRSALFLVKSEPSIVMFIGLRGVGTTKTCAKYARYHRKKGFRPALVCADTFNTNAFFRLKKVAKYEVPVYGSYTTDPAELAAEGIAKFKNEKRDLIIVDTSDRHQQYSTLFEEMRLLSESMNPDLIVYVMDSSIGQAAFDQAQAFKQSFTRGVVIVANINCNSKSCGAISAVAAAKCPMILTETGEKNSEEFEAFEAKPFVRRLLEQEKMRRYTTIMESMTDEGIVDDQNIFFSFFKLINISYVFGRA